MRLQATHVVEQQRSTKTTKRAHQERDQANSDDQEGYANSTTVTQHQQSASASQPLRSIVGRASIRRVVSSFEMFFWLTSIDRLRSTVPFW